MQNYIGFARTTWSSYENGAAQPDIEGILKIASFFGISVDELLRDDLSEDVNQALKITAGVDRVILNSESSSDQDAPALIRDLLLSEIVKSKQQVIETQARTIRALQALINRMSADGKMEV